VNLVNSEKYYVHVSGMIAKGKECDHDACSEKSRQNTRQQAVVMKWIGDLCVSSSIVDAAEESWDAVDEFFAKAEKLAKKWQGKKRNVKSV